MGPCPSFLPREDFSSPTGPSEIISLQSMKDWIPKIKALGSMARPAATIYFRCPHCQKSLTARLDSGGDDANAPIATCR